MLGKKIQLKKIIFHSGKIKEKKYLWFIQQNNIFKKCRNNCEFMNKFAKNFFIYLFFIF